MNSGSLAAQRSNAADGSTFWYAGDRWSDTGGGEARWFPVGLLLALCVHALPVVVLLFGAPKIGVRPSDLDGVTVELIDAVELKRRFPTTKEGRDAVSAPGNEVGPTASAAQPAQPASVPSPQNMQASAKLENEKSLSDQDRIDALTSSLESSFVVPPTKKLNLDMPLPAINKMANSERQGAPPVSAAERYIERRSRPAASRGGEMDAFTRSVATTVERLKPVSPGVGGRLTIEFVVGLDGRMEDLRITQTSGQAKLDELVLRAVKRAELIVPPPEATLRDRTFEITFTYR